MRAKTHGFVSALIEQAVKKNQKTQCFNELSQLSSILNSSGLIQEVLNDPVIPSDNKKQFLNDLFINKINEISLDLIGFIVTNEKVQEIISAIKEAAMRFSEAKLVGISELNLIFEDFTTRQGARDRYHGYVLGVSSGFSGKDLEEIEDVVFRFARIIESSSNLRSRLSDINVTTEAKVMLLADLIKSKVTDDTFKILSYPLRAGRQRDLSVSLDQAAKVLAELRGRKIGYVQSAVELTKEQISELTQKISQLIGNQVEVRQILNHDVIGGIQVTIGDFLIDRTLKTQLEQLKKQLLTSGGEKAS